MRDDLRRSRLTTLFRLPLTSPHLVWLLLWSVLAVVAGVVNWFAAVLLGQSPRRLHRFLIAYLRYFIHVSAFLMLVANPFPGFKGKQAGYPVDLEVDPPTVERRWKTLLRLVFLYEALLIFVALLWVPITLLSAVVFVCLFVSSLLRGRAPEGVRNLGAYLLRYQAQQLAYLLCVTARFPYSGPFYGTPPYV